MKRPASLRCAAWAAGVLTFLILPAASAAPTPGTLVVRPLRSRTQATGGPGSTLHARPPAPSLPAGLAERARLWRGFRDFISAPNVNWSREAARRQGWRPSLPPPTRSVRVESAQRAAHQLLGPPDTLRVAFIRIDFAHDRGGGASTGNGRFDLSNPGLEVAPVDPPPHNRAFYLAHLEALSRYYRGQSYGRTIVVGDVWPRSLDLAYTCNDMADFVPPDGGWRLSQDIYPPAARMFRAMMFAADAQSTQLGDRIPWQTYDRFVLIHAGSDLQNDVRDDSPDDIPSFTLGVADTDAVIFADSAEWNRERPIDRASVIPETINQDENFGAINGVLAHECGHNFFFFDDVYNVDTGLPVVGEWSLMDSGNLAGGLVALPDGSDIFATGILPPSVDPFQRTLTTDLLSFDEVVLGDTMRLQSGERHPDMRAVLLSSDEFLILENRYLAPVDSVKLHSDDLTHVVLGPENPDTLEYDALLPGGGILVWHIDQSVIPHEFTFPCDTGRANYGCGINTNPARLAISVIEADGLADLGDPNSGGVLGAPRDPYYRSNNPSLSDTTTPNLLPHIGTRPHVRIDFLDEADSTMRFSAFRTWQLRGWPIQAEAPAGGPQLLAIDVNGDRHPEVCWAGGDPAGPDSAALFAVQADGAGLFGPSPVFSRALDRVPLPVMAAIARSDDLFPTSPVFAVTTRAAGTDLGAGGGQVWLIDEHGQVVGGWPAQLGSVVTTPPVIVGAFRDTFVYVGCADGRVYAIGLDGQVRATSTPPLRGGVRGRLAVFPEPIDDGSGPYFPVAAGGDSGQVAVFAHRSGLSPLPGWPKQVGPVGFAPDFLWLDFGGTRSPSSGGSASQGCFAGALSLIVHDANWLWGYCLAGDPLAGWGRAVGDTLVAGLGAGDPDGDGYPEVLTQSLSSQVAFWNLDGYPSPGWPRRGTGERFRSGAAPLAADLTGTGSTQVITMNASGIVDAMGANGAQPDGWPLATGLDATGTPLLVDLDGDHFLELVAPDAHGGLYAYSLPTRDSVLTGISWPMLGGDPGRSSSLPSARTAAPPPPLAGPLIRGSLKAYPNPARRSPVTFAYRLTEPATVEFKLLDTSGHLVASFTRSGRQSDNVEVWEPGALPAGLYLARVRFRGATSERTEVIPVGLLR